ncbi:MAG: HDIG domain-containing metalloprotein [Candidatus Aenigmatarchaeota archaeon]
MTLPMTREQAVEFLKSMDQEESDMNHYLETEAIMRGLARKFEEDVEYWGILGLLHDVDWALTKNNVKDHCIKSAELLKEKGFDEKFIQAMQSHAYGHDEIPALLDKKRTEKIEHALTAAETLTGIIYAYALMRGKRISDMEVKGLKKKFKDRSFAANCDRNLIREIEITGLSLDDFFELAINSLKEIKEVISLQ